MKKCSRCKQMKDPSEFGKDKSRPDGLNIACKKCKSEANLKYRQNNRQAYLKSKNDSHKRNIEHELQYKKNYYIQNRVAIIAYQKNYAKKNPTKRSKIKSAYRGRKKSVSFLVLDKEIQKIKSSPCFACGAAERIEIDHIIPLSKGGRHSIGNLMPLCRSCNSSKSNKLLIEWKYATKRFHTST